MPRPRDDFYKNWLIGTLGLFVFVLLYVYVRWPLFKWQVREAQRQNQEQPK